MTDQQLAFQALSHAQRILEEYLQPRPHAGLKTDGPRGLICRNTLPAKIANADSDIAGRAQTAPALLEAARRSSSVGRGAASRRKFGSSSRRRMMMPASLERIRASMKVGPTAQQKGLVLNIRLIAYDNDMLLLDGIPLNDHVDDDTVTGWLGANEVITATVNEFYRQVMKR